MEPKQEKEDSFYFALFNFTLDWLKKQNKKGNHPKMSEIVGSLEIVKSEFYFTQAWFTKEISDEQMKKSMQLILEKLKGKEIKIDKDGNVIMMQMPEK